MKAEREAADNNLRITQAATRDEENKRQNAIRETGTILGIKNLAIECQDAIVRLQNEKVRLGSEIAKKSDRIALADTITDFLTRQPAYDFKMFYLAVEEIRKIRSGEYSTWKPVASSLEDGVRLEALKVFDGDFFFNQFFNKVWLDNARLQTENNSLKERVYSAERALSQRGFQPKGV